MTKLTPFVYNIDYTNGVSFWFYLINLLRVCACYRGIRGASAMRMRNIVLKRAYFGRKKG
ncbi:hypothetical protein K040078D81_17240 [Blautia hominis]|uniref:Uncharacterized protein n=1 Tax=Blautia hominis TaxID=2025493 RepID=A0ABQ0B836_9FIRM